MKLTYLNKTVEINIPSTTKRLKQQVLEDFFDSYKNADKEPYENEEFLFKLGSFEGSSDIEEIPVNVIGQWMSGGADSSLLAYLLCKKIRDEELDIKFQPISVRRGRANNPIYAGNVIDFIEEDLGVDFILPHEVYYPPLDDEYMREIKIFWERDDYNFRHRKFEILYSGITSNPPADDSTIPKNKERVRDDNGVDKIVEQRNGYRHYINPFINVNKKWEAEAYKDKELLDSLFPLTYSCEGSIEATKHHTQHCKRCWWCQERFWAFGRYV